MAEDMILSTTTSIIKTSTHESETPSNLLLYSFIEEVKKHPHDKCKTDLLKKCLSLSGMSFHGREALQVHTAIFRDIFVSCKSTKAGLGFSASDYLDLLRDEQLGWAHFLRMMLPYLRLQTSIDFLEKLIHYQSNLCQPSSHVGDIRLLLVALSLFHNITLDFLLAGQREDKSLGSEGDKTHHTSLDPSEHQGSELAQRIQSLVEQAISCISQLLTLSHQDKLLPAILKDGELLTELVQILSLAVVILNPYATRAGTGNHLLNCLKGRRVALQFDRPVTVGGKKKVMKREHSDDFVLTEVDLSVNWGLGSKNIEFNAERTDSTLQDGELVTVHAGSNPDSSDPTFEKLGHDLGFNSSCSFGILIDSVHGSTRAPSGVLFTDLIAWFLCQGTHEADLSNHLSKIFFEGKDFDVGRHVFSGVALYEWLLSFLERAASGSIDIQSLQNVTPAVQAEINERWLQFQACNLSCFRLTDTECLLKSGKELRGQEDLELVKTAVDNHKTGWRDLLVLGLQNLDLDNWWKAGFFDLVWEHEAALCTRSNVHKMLKLLCQVAARCQTPEDLKFRDKVNRLCGIMFKRLPTMLQEQLILSCLEDSSKDLHAPTLLKVISQEQIIQLLTPSLNRLTSVSVNQVTGHIMYLCLFDVHVVLQQALRVMLDNKAQILPVVKVLRQLPHVCRHTDKGQNQSQLLLCLFNVLSRLSLTDKIADNLIQTLSLFTEPYSLQVDIDPDNIINLTMPSLLSQSDIFHNFLCPSLDFSAAAESLPGGLDLQLTPGQSITTFDAGAGKSLETSNSSLEIAVVTAQSLNVSSLLSDSAMVSSCLNQPGQEEVLGGQECIQTDEARVATGDVNSTKLPLVVSLRLLSALLEKADTLELLVLRPFPLLAYLADLYVRNCFVFTSGELDKMKVVVKQLAVETISLLSLAISKHSTMFTPADFLWLKQMAFQQGLFHAALLAPALSIGCDLEELREVLSGSIRQSLEPGSQQIDIKCLILLLQLSLVNDFMLEEIMTVITQCHFSANHSILALAVSHMLTVALAGEMFRMDKSLTSLLANQDGSFTVDGSLFTTTPEDQICLEASLLLRDSVLLLSSSDVVSDEAWCHIASNYQAGVQSLLGQKTNFQLLISLFCHNCMVLSVMEAQPAQIIQVITLDILNKLKPYLCPREKLKKSELKSDLEEEDVRRGLCTIEDYTECVSQDSVKKHLYTQIVSLVS